MVLLSEQMRIINRILPVEFSEDEFRLTPELTHNRIYGKIKEIENKELLDIYLNIVVNYKEKFEDPNNKYFYLLNNEINSLIEERKIDIKKFMTFDKLKTIRINVLTLAFSIVYFTFFKSYIVLNALMFILLAFINKKWKKVIGFISKTFKIKRVKLHNYKYSPIIAFFAECFVWLHILRLNNSLLYLFVGYIFLFCCHNKCTEKLDESLKPILKEKKNRIYYALYKYGMYLIILFFLCPVIGDFFSIQFHGSNYKYFEGICTNVTSTSFGFEKAIINDIPVILNKKGKNVKVGNYYMIKYGNLTKAIVDVKEIDVKDIGKPKDKKETSTDEIRNNIEKNRKKNNK